MRVLVTGATGQLGSAICDELDRRAARLHKGPGIEVVAASHAKLDVTKRDETVGTVVELSPEVIIHAAAFTAVDACEAEPDVAFAVNAIGTRNIADGAALVGAHLLYVSTDYVFDGRMARPYNEWDLPNPLSVYGRSKLGGEKECGEDATIVRTSWVCGRAGANMAKTVLRLLEGDGALRFVDDQHGSPSIAEDIAPLLADLALSRRSGLFHVTNQGETTWFEFARAVAGFAGGDPARVQAISTAELDPPRPAPRPANSVLDNAALRLSGLELAPHWMESTERLVADLLS
jgi:dTDP-4-dehydrorhamnose reductase